MSRQREIDRGPLRSALFSTTGPVPGRPRPAPGPAARCAARSPLLPRRPAAPSSRRASAPRGALRVPGAPRPESRSRPAAGSGEPHFLRAGRGEARAFPVVQLKPAETSLHSDSLGCRRPRGQSSGAGGAPGLGTRPPEATRGPRAGPAPRTSGAQREGARFLRPGGSAFPAQAS